MSTNHSDFRSLKSAYSRSLAKAGAKLHFAAHSHHLWPDCSFDAHTQYWTDSARLWDAKWEKIFGEVLPNAARHLTQLIGIPDPHSLAFAPNTHELLMRILSSFPIDREVSILSSDSEFHSFTRQTRRLQELGRCRLTQVPSAELVTFQDRFVKAASSRDWDLVFISHVFFNTGYVLRSIENIIDNVSPRTVVVVDGYHAVGAIPVDLSSVAGRVFYLGGGYKYLQSGEGACYLHVPESFTADPSDTGWMAGIHTLDSESSGPVEYPRGGARFLGATFDPSGWYRFNAVMDWWNEAGIDGGWICDRTFRLQQQFLSGLREIGSGALDIASLVSPPKKGERGAFLSFELSEAEGARHLVEKLLARGVIVDRRGKYVRVGFGLYHDPEDVDGLLSILQTI